MIEDTLIDDQSLEVGFYEKIQEKNKTYIKFIILLSIVNTILFPFVTIEAKMPIKERFWTAALSNFITLPILFFLLGLVFAFIPYKNLIWSQKYSRASLLPLLTIHIIMTIGFILTGFALLYKYYYLT